MAKLFANSGDPDQRPRSAASDLGLHCLPISLLRVSQLQWVNAVECVSSFHPVLLLLFIFCKGSHTSFYFCSIVGIHCSGYLLPDALFHHHGTWCAQWMPTPTLIQFLSNVWVLVLPDS